MDPTSAGVAEVAALLDELVIAKLARREAD
jgi:hypothetical protein